MILKLNSVVRLKTFHGTTFPDECSADNENYWLLINQEGEIIETNKTTSLVLFEDVIDKLGLENHNPIKNSLWIKNSDLVPVM